MDQEDLLCANHDRALDFFFLLMGSVGAVYFIVLFLCVLGGGLLEKLFVVLLKFHQQTYAIR